MSRHPNSEFTKILTDTIHYPEIAKAYNAMSIFDQIQIDADLEDCVNDVLEELEGDVESREHAAFEDGYNEGSNDNASRIKKDVKKLMSHIESLLRSKQHNSLVDVVEVKTIIDELEALL